MVITLSGTGTSFGIPVIGCNCHCCLSNDIKDKRFRSSAFIRASDGTCIAIDVGPEFRLQALKHKITHVDAIFVTHSHADHLHGLDDVRVFSHTCTGSGKETPGDGLKIYASGQTIADIKDRFSYIFHPTQQGGGKPKIKLVDCLSYSKQNPIKIGSLEIFPVPLMHGELSTTGYVICDTGVINTYSNNDFVHSFAYLTDCSFISQESIELVKNTEFLVIDALRQRGHSTHFSFNQAFEVSHKIHAKKTWFTHISHDMTYVEITEYLNSLLTEYDKKFCITVECAYDGLEIEV